MDDARGRLEGATVGELRPTARLDVDESLTTGSTWAAMDELRPVARLDVDVARGHRHDVDRHDLDRLDVARGRAVARCRAAHQARGHRLDVGRLDVAMSPPWRAAAHRHAARLDVDAARGHRLDDAVDKLLWAAAGFRERGLPTGGLYAP